MPMYRTYRYEWQCVVCLMGWDGQLVLTECVLSTHDCREAAEQAREQVHSLGYHPMLRAWLLCEDGSKVCGINYREYLVHEEIRA